MQRADINCGSSAGILTQSVNPATDKRDVNCFGVKPNQNIKVDDQIFDWNTTRFSQFS